MKTGKLLQRGIAALVALLLMLTLLAVPAFAEGDESTTGETSSEATGSEESTSAETESGESSSEEDASAEDSSSAATTGTTTDSGDGNDGLSKTAIAWIIVGIALVAVIVIFALRYRSKIGGFFRLYKSELKKVSWLSWSQTKKSTLVVLVVLLICAVVICLLDYALSSGFIAIINAVK